MEEMKKMTCNTTGNCLVILNNNMLWFTSRDLLLALIFITLACRGNQTKLKSVKPGSTNTSDT